MVVYLDVIWALNLLFDSLLLYLTAIILKRKINFLRLLAGGFIGSLIILLSFTPINVYSGHPISKLLFSLVMVYIVFGYKRLSFFIKALMTFYLATFLIGGALMGVHYFIQYDPTLTAEVLKSSVMGLGDPVSWLFVMIGFPVAWHYARKNIENMEMTKIQYEKIVRVTIKLSGEALHFSGLVDSGNQLYDPISKLPVMFVSIKNQLECIPEPIRKLATITDPLMINHDELPIDWQPRLRIVPYKVVGQEHQFVLAIKPDMIMIEQDRVKYFCDKGLVTFTNQQLSSDDSFECIVHPKMLTGTKQTGETVKVS
ncbi:sigma-E processing peptidase SpoIIGA [Bacillus sp. JJ1764]|uniref:sigma-E processing peptidase SpoIIGA n=1 Tax=Bacillus sp. JJ1764 TaxID=3122964 RepID=UPI002FFE970A